MNEYYCVVMIMRSTLSALLVLCMVTMISCTSSVREVEPWEGMREIHSVHRLPAGVKKYLDVNGENDRANHASESSVADNSFPLQGVADRGQPFSVGCTGDGAKRRFVVAGMKGDSALVAIERGGIAYGVDVMLFTDLDRAPKVRQQWALGEVPASLSQLIDTIASRRPLPLPLWLHTHHIVR